MCCVSPSNLVAWPPGTRFAVPARRGANRTPPVHTAAHDAGDAAHARGRRRHTAGTAA